MGKEEEKAKAILPLPERCKSAPDSFRCDSQAQEQERDMDTIPITSALYSAKQPLHRKLPKTGNWGPAEDARLRQAVSKYGFRWILVADEVGTRNGDQCAKRWKDNLDPQLDHSQWSPDEVSDS